VLSPAKEGIIFVSYCCQCLHLYEQHYPLVLVDLKLLQGAINIKKITPVFKKILGLVYCIATQKDYSVPVNLYLLTPSSPFVSNDVVVSVLLVVTITTLCSTPSSISVIVFPSFSTASTVIIILSPAAIRITSK
jgi:hypothetical protein